MRAPKISVIINTNGRCASLMKTVAALEQQFYLEFELCIVVGPVADGTTEFAKDLADRRGAKVAFCPEANISMSRNIGIQKAAGELVAFLDDDALPEPVWLEQLAPLFEQPRVAGVSGLVFHPDSREIQFRYSFCDRFGTADHVPTSASSPHAYPLSPRFPHVMGANCIFSRAALVAVGGFDEEYEYYLDEADLCCRLVDAGYDIAHADWAPVHHKYLSGATRDGAGVTIRRKTILKNQIYFSLKNARGHASLREIAAKAGSFTAWHRADIEHHIRAERLPPQTLVSFDADAEAAWEDGFVRGLTRKRRLRESFTAGEAFQRFGQRVRSNRPRHVAVVQPFDNKPVQSFKPSLIDRDVIRIFEIAADPDGVVEGADFGHGVWRHRVSPEKELPGTDPDLIATKRRAVDRALDRVAAFHPFDEIIDHSGAGAE